MQLTQGKIPVSKEDEKKKKPLLSLAIKDGTFFIYPEKTIIPRDTCHFPNVCRTLFTIARTWKQPKFPSTEDCIKMWTIYTMEYY